MTATGLELFRATAERALSAGGLHVAMGSQLWDLYRCPSACVQSCSREDVTSTIVEFLTHGCDLANRFPSRDWELSVLASGAGGDKQSERVRSLFHRQLQVPLAQGPAAMAAYKEWEASGEVGRPAAAVNYTVMDVSKTVLPLSAMDSSGFPFVTYHPSSHLPNRGVLPCMQVPEHVQKGYDKAQAAVALRAANEAAVAAGKDADSELLAAYMAYTKLEEAQGDPARVQVPPCDP